MSVPNVRVELKNYNPNASHDERWKAFKNLLGSFHRQVNESGVLSLWKKYQYYESKSEKKRRKRKEAELERQKERLRDHFTNQ